ncbi:MAG TPA: arsenic resistance N-acetyltransferase ArsN2 [Noviherbaspirillum sp.]
MIDAARPDDLADVKLLLEESGLPADDLTAGHLQHFMVVRGGGSITACIAIEPHGTDALLRSLAVSKGMRGDGCGRKLVAAMEEYARSKQVASLYLLTTTAASFFERLGYQRIERADAPPSMQKTTQFSMLCPSSSTCLFKSISSTISKEIS